MTGRRSRAAAELAPLTEQAMAAACRTLAADLAAYVSANEAADAEPVKLWRRDITMAVGAKALERLYSGNAQERELACLALEAIVARARAVSR